MCTGRDSPQSMGDRYSDRHLDRLDGIQSQQPETLVKVREPHDEIEARARRKCILASWHTDRVGLPKRVVIAGQPVIAEASQLVQRLCLIIDRQASIAKSLQLRSLRKMRLEGMWSSNDRCNCSFEQFRRPANEKPPT